MRADGVADMDVHHIGIATPDATKLTSIYTELTATSIAHEETLDDLQVVFLEGDSTYLELLEPRSDSGTIARFLDRSGPGLHHVAFETEDITTALDQARSIGIELIDSSPRPGAWGHQVAFLHPDDTGGVLIEFVQS